MLIAPWYRLELRVFSIFFLCYLLNVCFKYQGIPIGQPSASAIGIIKLPFQLSYGPRMYINIEETNDMDRYTIKNNIVISVLIKRMATRTFFNGAGGSCASTSSGCLYKLVDVPASKPGPHHIDIGLFYYDHLFSDF